MLLLLFLVTLFSYVISQAVVHPECTLAAFSDDINPCLPHGDITTTCKRLQECPHAIQGIQNGQFPKICNFRGRHPDVCCPDVIPTISAISTTTPMPSDVGDICKDGSPPWYCTRYSNCPEAKEIIKNGGIPKVCPSNGVLLVCCPPSNTSHNTQPLPSTTSLPATTSTSPSWIKPGRPDFPLPRPNRLEDEVPLNAGSALNKTRSSMQPTMATNKESKADEMCKAYGKYVFKTMAPTIHLAEQTQQVKISFCGRGAESLIVGGVEAGPREFPHMARIGYGNEANIQWLCGGSLISERFVLSAAHCTRINTYRIASWANLGDLDTSTDEDEAEPVTIRIVERFIHPEYNSKELYHDIALFKLERDVPLGIYIRPICLNTKRTIPQSKATVTGWGHTEHRGRLSTKLQKIEVGFVENNLCNNSYRFYTGKGLQLPRGIISDYMICAGGDRQKDACQGDSGGPMQIALDSPFCMYSIIGVTSFGKGCATSTPGVYTNVANYVTWIESIVWPA